ncbi:fatty acid activator Faa4 [Aspergillus affinis]|uniref:fatty acid activator Faa4 n=1 Tax=Aspergillus affinis TaxID=1070780 RepID=UPI0022FE3F68|nr:fatty acid activator Faa4 [Aspergillus affinis]KAI9046088.1 fatty acid activator Faa4 [Aspergillus affinis]
MEKRAPFSYEVPGVEKVDGETAPRRNVRCKDGLITQPDPSVRTVYDIVTYAANKFGNARCIGSRTLLDVHKEKKKVKKIIDGRETEVEKEWSYFELSPYNFLSFVEFQKHVGTLGAGLKKLGLTKGDKIHLYGATSMNWLSLAHGAFTQTFTIVTAYDTLGLEGLRSSLKQTKSKAVFLDAGLLPVLIKALSEAPTVETIILNNETKVNPEELEKLKAQFPNIHVIELDELKTLGEENPAEHVVPEPDDLACVMYTSGTSGTPKGVTIKHKAVVASVAGATSIVGDYIGPGDGLLTYLPQAHIIEFIFENAALFWGATMGYGSPKTLTDTSVRNCKGDILEFRPSILVGVPAVWETIRKGIVAKVNAGSFLTRNLFGYALTWKQFLLSTGIPGVSLLDAIVFSKVRDATGGRLRICMSGGGPLAKNTQKFISTAICPLISGYGLTETGGMGALNDPRALTFEAHGDIPASVEEKLVDFPEAGYFTSNNPPQGELWIRGPSVTGGYYENEEETKVALRDDGWFMTGDIAEFDKNGHVKIIDRKKNLVKTLNGEYIALEKLESIYRASPLVANICVYAAQDQQKPVAIIVPAEPALLRLARENNIQGHDLEDLVDHPQINSLVLRELQKAGRQGQLSAFEIIDGVVLDKDEWTPHNGYVTAAQKIQRKKIFEKNKKGVDKACAPAVGL